MKASTIRRVITAPFWLLLCVLLAPFVVDSSRDGVRDEVKP
jgi:hypothetical protein